MIGPAFHHEFLTFEAFVTFWGAAAAGVGLMWYRITDLFRRKRVGKEK